jgi:hypothetical protein
MAMTAFQREVLAAVIADPGKEAWDYARVVYADRLQASPRMKGKATAVTRALDTLMAMRLVGCENRGGWRWFWLPTEHAENVLKAETS